MRMCTYKAKSGLKDGTYLLTNLLWSCTPSDRLGSYIYYNWYCEGSFRNGLHNKMV